MFHNRILIYMFFAGYHWISRQAVDAQRNLQLVPKHVLLFSAQCCHMEGTISLQTHI